MSITLFNTDCTLDDLISRSNDIIAERDTDKEVFIATSGKQFILWAGSADVQHLFQSDLVDDDEKDALEAEIIKLIPGTSVEYPPTQTHATGPCCALLNTAEAMTAKYVYDTLLPLVESVEVPSFKLHHVDLVGIKESE